MNRPYDDFTEASYRWLLADVSGRYTFGSFLQPPDDPHVLWRHDIDLSPHRALSLARIEADAGVRATYFVRVRGPFYSVFERPVAAILNEIARNHDIGLHAEPASAEREDVYDCLHQDRRILEAAIEQTVRTFSFHNPTVAGLLQYDEAMIEELVNAFSRRFSREYAYVSDSGGSWRRPIAEFLDPQAHPRLHVATHPEWWTEIAMNPTARIWRGINGRAATSWQTYTDEIDARFGVAT